MLPVAVSRCLSSMSLEIPKSRIFVGLQVAVNYSIVVCDADCRQQLLHQVDRDVDAESSVLVQPGAHRASLDPFHDDEKDGAVFIEVVHTDDSRVIERGHGRGFPMEALAEAGVARVLRGQGLDGNRDLEAWMRRAVDHAHRAAPELRFNRIPAELCRTHPWPMEESVCRTLQGDLGQGTRPGPNLEAGLLHEDAEREVERNSEVGLVDDLADSQVSGQAAEDVRILSAQPMVGSQPRDGV